MEDVGNTTVYPEALRIIVNDRIIDHNNLKWRIHDEQYEELTLNEISEQINTVGVIYVWTEMGLSGKIYQYGNYEEVGWCLHGTTKGYS